MLFDLRGRGRRRTVQGVYLGLAVLLGAGLILFGVGTGIGGGGLLNGVSSSNSGSNQSQVIKSDVDSSLKAEQADPTSASAMGSLIEARWVAASSTAGFDASTKTFTAAGKRQLQLLTQNWQQYLQLTKSPDVGISSLVARVYSLDGQYGNAASAWDTASISSPGDPSAYECLTINAYAAGQSRKGDLAMTKALSLVPKASKTQIQQILQGAKTSSTTAKSYAGEYCGV
jgi:hypothetical protein